MSRSGYSEDFDGDEFPNAINLYRNAVACAFKGKRGQAFLADLAAALDAMPDKRLAASVWVEPTGEACALGVAALSRGLGQKFSAFDPDDSSAPEEAAHLLNIAPAMARELVWLNDESASVNETPEARWTRMRDLVEGLRIKP
jgi:hypothetical protein